MTNQNVHKGTYFDVSPYSVSLFFEFAIKGENNVN